MTSWRERLRGNISNACEMFVKHGPTLGWGTGVTCSAAAMGASVVTAALPWIADPVVVDQVASFVTRAVIPVAAGGVTGIAVGVAADKFKDYCMEHYREWYDHVMQDKKTLADNYKELSPDAKGRVIHMLREHPSAQEIFAREGLLSHLMSNGSQRLSHAMDSAETINQEVRASSPREGDPKNPAPGQ